jgi:hypothetical protein
MRPLRLAQRPRRLCVARPVALGIVVTVMLTGCASLKGGGWIPSLSLGQKATFGFSAKCQDTTIEGVPVARLYEGQFEFDDHSFSPLVRVHGDVEPDVFGTVPEETCSQVSKETALMNLSGFRGTYQTQPDVVPSLQGEFAVAVFDGGEPATINGDMICVDLVGPGLPVAGYTNCGVVQGGNIQIR